MGHAFFIEDGIENGNTIQYNLGVFVQTSSTLLITDVTPATFWVTNPNNTGKFKRILEKMFLPVNLLNLRFSCFQFVTMPRLAEATMAFGTTCPTSLGDLHSPPQSVQRNHLWGSSRITLLIRSEGNFCYILFIRLVVDILTFTSSNVVDHSIKLKVVIKFFLIFQFYQPW